MEVFDELTWAVYLLQDEAKGRERGVNFCFGHSKMNDSNWAVVQCANIELATRLSDFGFEDSGSENVKENASVNGRRMAEVTAKVAKATLIAHEDEVRLDPTSGEVNSNFVLFGAQPHVSLLPQFPAHYLGS